MPITSPTSLPLNAVRSAARTRLASQGATASNLYVHDAIYKAGEIIQPRRDNIVIPVDCVMVFADDEPLMNWGHRCRYLLHHPKTGELIQEIPAHLPPTLDFGANFKAFHMPTRFLVGSAFQYPIAVLPPGIYRPASEWYAILFAGASMNRHVNDIEFLYRTLVHLYRVPKANITVLSYDGTLDYNDANWQRVPSPVGNWPGDNTPYQIKIDGAGTKEALLNAIAAVGKKLGATDNLLLHTNNHGSNSPGVSLISYSGDDTTPTDLANAIKALPKFNALMVMMEQCFSGGFLQPILQASPAKCTSVATAVDANTSSAGGPEYDPFALQWICAMATANPDGSGLSSSPATNPEGQVTAWDAFAYAKATDPATVDDPQFGQNTACGGAVALGGGRLIVQVPPIWQYLYPWQFLPDPGPEEIVQLAGQVAERLKSDDVGAAVRASISDQRTRLFEVVLGAVAKKTT